MLPIIIPIFPDQFQFFTTCRFYSILTNGFSLTFAL